VCSKLGLFCIIVGWKHEIRISKSETNSKHENEKARNNRTGPTSRDKLRSSMFAIVVIVSILVSGGLEKGRPSIIGEIYRILSKIRGVLPG